MEIVKTLIWAINILSAISIIVLVLMQHGKGADMGAAFGSGASGSLFGASGSANFLSRSTAVAAVIFFATSLGLTYLSSGSKNDLGIMGNQVEQKVIQVPAPASAPSGKPKTGAPVIPE